MTECFELLGLTDDALPEDVRSAWRRLASEHHPDKGGDGEKFNEIRQAYKEALIKSQVNLEVNLECLVCDGEGRVVSNKQRGFTNNFKIMCPACRGSGLRS